MELFQTECWQLKMFGHNTFKKLNELFVAQVCAHRTEYGRYRFQFNLHKNMLFSLCIFLCNFYCVFSLFTAAFSFQLSR